MSFPFFNKKNLIQFAVVALIFSLWVWWTGFYWLFLGNIVLFDVFLTRLIPWAFWKKRQNKKYVSTPLSDWIDAFLIAVTGAAFIKLFILEAFTIPSSSMEKTLLVGDYLFVSKINYGPRMPYTPLALPFTNHTFTLTNTNSYSNKISWPYHRLKSFGQIKIDDVIVFNFPEGDTVILEYPDQSYYSLLRQYGREFIQQNFTKVWRPIDMRENYVKRCKGIPGDTISIVHGNVIVNGVMEEESAKRQYNYFVKTTGETLSPELFEKIGVAPEDQKFNSYNALYDIPLTYKASQILDTFPHVINVTRYENTNPVYSTGSIFPNSRDYLWTEDNYGPLVVPKKGDTLILNQKNIRLYKRIISPYENNTLEINDSTIIINNLPTDHYVVKLNYYFVMGDNRHNSADSRYWGFVPENHIVGKAFFIWLSVDKNKTFPKNVRWNKMFQYIR